MKRIPDPNQRTPVLVDRIVGCLLAGTVGGIVLALLGFVVGSTYGGNYATDFNFNGMRGYEATGQIGTIIAFAVGALLCALLFLLLVKRCR